MSRGRWENIKWGRDGEGKSFSVSIFNILRRSEFGFQNFKAAALAWALIFGK